MIDLQKPKAAREDVRNYAIGWIREEYCVTVERADILFSAAYARKPEYGTWYITDLTKKIAELATGFLSDAEASESEYRRKQRESEREISNRLSGLSDRKLLEEIYRRLVLS